MSEKPKGKSLIKRIAYLLMLLTGGAGIGGWKFKDYPVVGRVIASVTGDAVSGETSLSEVARASVTRVLDSAHDYSQSGMYEVRIEELQLDPAAYKEGQTVEMKVRLRAVSADGRESIVWDSASRGVRKAVAGRDTLKAAWPHEPIQVAWSPGESLELEVYGKKMFRDTVSFRTHVTESDQFPLKSGTQTLVNIMSGGRSGDPEASRVVLTSERIGDRPYATAAASQVAKGNPIGRVLK